MKDKKEDMLKLLKELSDDFHNRGIEKMALFGSFAKDSQTLYSDIDIAIKKSDDFLDRYSAYDYFDLVNEIKDRVSKKLHKRVDIFDLDSVSDLKSSIEQDLIYV
jgi:predicted nucleotidyltransferase